MLLIFTTTLLIHLAVLISFFDNLTGNFVLADSPKEEHLLLRGVHPQLASFYSGKELFTCLDGNGVIPFDQVNDDYCDCADGSDEPGTSACRNGKFYCRNHGFRPTSIPSSRVNDNICDCCDGSDEWSNTESNNNNNNVCPNICEKLGSEASAEAKKLREAQQAGWKKRLELAAEGRKLLEERALELEQRKSEMAALEGRKVEAEEEKASAEKLESEAKHKAEEQWEVEKKRLQMKEAEILLNEMDLDNDGKMSIAEFRKYAGMGLSPPPSQPTPLPLPIDHELSDGGKVETDENKKEEEDKEEEKMLREIFSENAENLDLQIVYEKLGRIKEMLSKYGKIRRKKEKQLEEKEKVEEAEGGGSEEEEKHETEPNLEKEEKDDGPIFDEDTKKLIENAEEARKKFDDIDGQIAQLRDEIKNSEQFLEQEYGADQAWAPLKGKCGELTTTQYTYKVCLFDRTIQKERSGHGEVALGYWGSWAGSHGDLFVAQKYEHGQSCWNGPERSTIVELLCGAEIELVEASEPNKCEYRFVVKAPAACRDPAEEMGEKREEL